MIKIKYRFGFIKKINQTLYALECFDVHTIACTEASGAAIQVKWFKLWFSPCTQCFYNFTAPE